MLISWFALIVHLSPVVFEWEDHQRQASLSPGFSCCGWGVLNENGRVAQPFGVASQIRTCDFPDCP